MDDSLTSLSDALETHEASSSDPSTVLNDSSKTSQKKTCEQPESSKFPKKKNNSLKDPAISNSKVMPLTQRFSQKPGLQRDDSLTPQLFSDKFQFNCQITSLYMVSTAYENQLDPNRYNEVFILYVCKKLAPYEYLTYNNQTLSPCQ